MPASSRRSASSLSMPERQVGLAPPAIEDRHLVTGRVQRAEQSQSDEAGAAEEEGSHVRRPFSAQRLVTGY